MAPRHVTGEASPLSSQPIIKRIAIVGNAGGGKSSLARRLGRTLDLPVLELDAVEWQPGWVRTPHAEITALHARWLAKPAWIIDGWDEGALMDARFAAADAIVVVDHAFGLHVARVLKRYLAAKLGLTTHWPPHGCAPAMLVVAKLLRFMWRVDREVVPGLLAMLGDERFRARVVHLRSPGEMRTWEQRFVNPDADDRTQ